MPLPGPLEPQAGNSLDRLLRCEPALLDTTLDQLRTLVAVHETGTALGAAKVLGREQSSVQKQIDTMNRNFGELCGEPLVRKQGRGLNVLFTDTGKALVDLAGRTLGTWLDEIQECRRRLGRTLTVGTTRYTLGYLSHASERVAGDFQRRGIDLKMVHVRTRNLLEKLTCHQVDLVCGSVLDIEGTDRLADYDVQEWRRSDLVLATNLPPSRLPARTIGTRELPSLPLVLPTAGLITDFVRGWFGDDYRDRLDVVAEIDTAQYGFELLGSGLVRGCMLVTQGIGEAALAGRLAAASGLRLIDLVGDLEPKMSLLVGVFARRGERAALPADHPLNLLWTALSDDTPYWRAKDAATDGQN
jgi:DNA-binding transcriptional LysR family regulator